MRHDPDPVVGPVPEGAHLKPGISYFTAEGVVFRDGTDVKVDAVLLATGYDFDDGNVLITDRQAHSSTSYSEKLVTNTRYIFPLHRHILSLSPSYPVNALAFIGLPSAIANCPSDIPQSLFATHVVLNNMHLPSRKELLRDLARHEDNLRKAGYDPYSIGHRLRVNTSSYYQDELVAYLKESGALPDGGQNYVEKWRRDIFTYSYLKQGWKRIESLGKEREWLAGVKTEA